MKPEQIVERVWPGRPVTIEPLGGGITNHNFRVDVGDETFVLRIGGQDTELLGIERFAEHAASLVAAELGLAPGVVAFLEPEGYLVTRYVDGVVGKVDVAQVGAALRRLHDGPADPEPVRQLPRGRGLPGDRRGARNRASRRRTTGRVSSRVGSRSGGAASRSVRATTTS